MGGGTCQADRRSACEIIDQRRIAHDQSAFSVKERRKRSEESVSDHASAVIVATLAKVSAACVCVCRQHCVCNEKRANKVVKQEEILCRAGVII